MTTAFEAFDLNVLVGAGRQLWISARSRLGAVYAVPRTPDEAAWEVLAEASADVEDAVRFAEHDHDRVRAIGETLRDTLFGDPDVLALFQRSRGAAADQGRPLLIGVLGAPDVVAGLPWELTFDPEGGPHRFLTLAPDAHVLRLPRTRTYPVTGRPIAPPLNLLLVLSSPTPSASGEALPFDLYEEKQSILDELAPLIAEGRLVVDVEDRPSVENLRRRVSGRARGYHVVHYLGHARETELVLENRLGGVRNVAASAFVRVLQSSPDLRLVVYTGCLTARHPEAVDGSGAGRPWSELLSIADLSVRVAAPAVVGMQAVLPFRTERIFARFFYRALASGRSLPDAVQLARAAIGSDEFVGNLLDWSVPTLFVGGQDPGPLLDPAMPPGEVQRTPRVELKLGLEEEERSTFARPVALREAVNVLSGRRANRALVVTGSAEVRTPFVGRVLDDLGDEVSVVLYVPSAELVAEADPALALCRYVAELLTRVDGQVRERPEKWSGAQWWSRLVEEVVTCPAVIAIDDVEELSPAAVTSIGNALQRLTLRRTRTHVVLAGTTVPPSLLGERAMRYAFPIRLSPLEWTDLWPWIRRNLPELNRSDQETLKECYESGLQDDLVLWSRLAEVYAGHRGRDPRSLVPEVLAAHPQPVRSRPALPALRAALTNPAVACQVGPFAEWMTALASDHGVGGRVSEPSRSHDRAPVAELLEVTSPFDATGRSTEPEILTWLDQVNEHGADVVLLDFGWEGRSSPVWETICADLAARGVLLIAAGGNSGDAGPQYPAWYGDVLAVGPLDATGCPTGYASWNPDQGKPDLFAPEDLRWARHAEFVPAGARGSSYSSLGAMAAAILVWSVDRSRSAADVRRILVETAREGDAERDGERAGFRALDLDAALRRVRQDLLLDTARTSPASRRELLAATGLSAGVALPIIDDLAARGLLRPMADHDIERLGVPADPAGADRR